MLKSIAQSLPSTSKLSFTIFVTLHRAPFPHSNFIFVVEMKEDEGLLEEKSCI